MFTNAGIDKPPIFNNIQVFRESLCFEREPHYHYAWSKNDRYVPLDTAAEGGPLQWTLARLRTRLPAMLIQADEPDLAREFDQRDIDAALPKIAGWAEALQAQARH